MNTPRVTIGVPVRNGESDLAACLACLSGQTYRELSIMVFDNASTDRTPEIIEQAMQVDERIQYIRHENDIGMVANFLAALGAASSPYFMWRAYDDLSDASYVERLVAALDANPNAMLAAPGVHTLRVPTGKLRIRLPPAPGTGPRERLKAERWMIRHLQAGWVYGLYRREFLVETYAFIAKAYLFAWAGDFLMLTTYVLRAEIVGVPEATLTLQLTGAPKEYSSSSLRAERIALVRNYWQVLEHLLAEKELPLHQRLLFRLSFVWHVQRRVAKWPILLRVLLGAKGSGPSVA